MNPPARCDLIARCLVLAAFGACMSVACGGGVQATTAPDASESTNAPDATNRASTGPSADSAVDFGAEAEANAASGDDAGLQDGTLSVTPADSEASVPFCNILACSVPTGCTTSLSGTVYDPAGRVPLYNAVVFVPANPMNPLPPITTGAKSCASCGAIIGQYIAVAATDVTGHFRITGVPATTHVPLVVQVGKWRREVFLDQVSACVDNPVPPALSRLPRNQSEGDLPQLAVVTGGCDDIGCFMRSIGIDASEFSAPHQGGRLDVYRGGAGTAIAPGLSTGTAGDCTGSACPLWSTKANLEYYDLVLMGCECGETLANKPATSVQAVHDWLDEGGRVLATHSHYTWFKNGPADFQGVATWLGASTETGSGNYNVDTSSPKGQVLHDWLGLTGVGFPISGVGDSVSSVTPPTQRWIYDPASAASDTKVMSFQTPVVGISPEAGYSLYCGKAVFSDVHAGASPSGDIPGACSGGPLTESEKALEFFLFDSSVCVPSSGQPPPGSCRCP